MTGFQWDDELQDQESPSDFDLDDETSVTLPCPACGAEIYEDAEQCPACGQYVTASTAVRPIWWWTAFALLLLLFLYLWVSLASSR